MAVKIYLFYNKFVVQVLSSPSYFPLS